MTPSKPRSLRPFCTATAAPPITDTMTTSAVVPSTIPARVRIERSLWPRISATEVRTDSVRFIYSYRRAWMGLRRAAFTAG